MSNNKSSIHESAQELSKQIKTITDTLNKNQDALNKFVEERNKIMGIAASSDDVAKWIKNILNERIKRYKDKNQSTISRLIYGSDKSPGDLREIIYHLSTEVVRENTVGDIDFLLFMLQKPIFDNIENVVSDLLPENTIESSERKIKIDELDNKIEMLEKECDDIIDKIKSDGLIDIAFDYSEYTPPEYTPPPATPTVADVDVQTIEPNVPADQFYK